MRNDRLNWKSCSGTSTAAINASEALSQTNALAIKPAPCAMAPVVSMRPIDMTSLNSQLTTPAHTPATTKHLSSALPSSVTPCRPNTRLIPLNGLMRVKSGTMATGLKFQPPSTTEASRTRQIKAPNIGRMPIKPLSIASPMNPVMDPVSSRRCGSKLRELRKIRETRPTSEPLMATSVTLPPIMVAKFVNSRDRGI
jgi:hypothetical protein